MLISCSYTVTALLSLLPLWYHYLHIITISTCHSPTSSPSISHSSTCITAYIITSFTYHNFPRSWHSETSDIFNRYQPQRFHLNALLAFDQTQNSKTLTDSLFQHMYITPCKRPEMTPSAYSYSPPSHEPVSDTARLPRNGMLQLQIGLQAPARFMPLLNPIAHQPPVCPWYGSALRHVHHENGCTAGWRRKELVPGP